MERLRNKFLSVSLDTVLHPASLSAQQAATEQKDKATMALGEALHQAGPLPEESRKQEEAATQQRAEEESRKKEAQAKRLAMAETQRAKERRVIEGNHRPGQEPIFTIDERADTTFSELGEWSATLINMSSWSFLIELNRRDEHHLIEWGGKGWLWWETMLDGIVVDKYWAATNRTTKIQIGPTTFHLQVLSAEPSFELWLNQRLMLKSAFLEWSKRGLAGNSRPR
jgi:hypothetical protein